MADAADRYVRLCGVINQASMLASFHREQSPEHAAALAAIRDKAIGERTCLEQGFFLEYQQELKDRAAGIDPAGGGFFMV
jgi:hypothetical protein